MRSFLEIIDSFADLFAIVSILFGNSCVLKLRALLITPFGATRAYDSSDLLRKADNM